MIRHIIQCLCVECLVYAVIALFVIAASLALHDCITTLFHLLPISDHYKSVCDLWFSYAIANHDDQ